VDRRHQTGQDHRLRTGHEKSARRAAQAFGSPEATTGRWLERHFLFFAENRDRDFSAEDIVVALRPRIITVDAAKEYAASFTERLLLTETDGRFKYAAPQDLDHGVGELLRAYTERPVSLIIAIHHIALGHIESLTDRP
jgi:hypothetical protein